MSTKGKRMANNSDNKNNINSEELYDNANIFNNTTYTFDNCCRAWSGWIYICKW